MLAFQTTIPAGQCEHIGITTEFACACCIGVPGFLNFCNTQRAVDMHVNNLKPSFVLKGCLLSSCHPLPSNYSSSCWHVALFKLHVGLSCCLIDRPTAHYVNPPCLQQHAKTALCSEAANTFHASPGCVFPSACPVNFFICNACTP